MMAALVVIQFIWPRRFYDVSASRVIVVLVCFARARVVVVVVVVVVVTLIVVCDSLACVGLLYATQIRN